MQIRALILTFFVDALLNYEEQEPGSFTLNAWLLLQLILVRSPTQAEQSDLVLDPPWSTTVAFRALLDEVQTLLAAAQSEWDGATTGQDEAAVLTKYSELLLTKVETYLPQILVPSEWQLHWMGVEG